MNDLEVQLEFAFDLSELAASISLPPFRSRAYATHTKTDGSPVTDIDREVEKALRTKIAEERLDHMVLGEEAGLSGASEWCWLLDPIDGTSRYVNGDPRWMTLIALAHRDRIVLGVVDMPALSERWWAARESGAFHNGKPIAVSTTGELTEATINDDWRQHIAKGDRDHPLSIVAAACGSVRPHQGASALAVASGQADVAISIGSHPWDYAAMKVIVEEAGGSYTAFDGSDRIDTGEVIATNGRLHAQALGLLSHPPTSR